MGFTMCDLSSATVRPSLLCSSFFNDDGTIQRDVLVNLLNKSKDLTTQHNRILNFQLVLPYFLPLSENYFCGLRYTDMAKEHRVGCSIMSFRSFDSFESLHTSSATYEQPMKRTYVDCLFSFHGASGELIDVDDIYSFALDSTFCTLNDVIALYMRNTADAGVWSLSQQMCDSKIEIKLFNNTGEQLFENFPVVINQKYSTFNMNRDVLSDSRTNEIFRAVGDTIRGEVNPFSASFQLLIEGQHLYNEGYYGSSVVLLHTAIESLVYTLREQTSLFDDDLRRRLMDNKRARKKAKSGDSFSIVFAQDLPLLLGFFGTNKKKFNDLSSDYRKSVYKIRNNVVHKGAVVSHSDCENALMVADFMSRYIVDSALSRSPALSAYLDKPDGLLGLLM